jgi:hypothetical protein
MNPLFRFALLLSLLLCSGCSTWYKVEPIVSTKKSYVESWSEGSIFTGRRQVLNPYTFAPAAARGKDGRSISNRSESLYALASGSDAAKARNARNQLQEALIRLSKDTASKHLAELKHTDNVANLALGGATLAASGGATVASEAGAKALAAAATGLTGYRELFNDQVYRNALVESLIQSIETDRQEFLETEIRRKQALSIADYNVEAALADAYEFHSRGSFYHGLALIREATEEKSAERREAVRLEVRSKTHSPAERDQLAKRAQVRTLLQDQAKAARAQQWVTQQPQLQNHPQRNNLDRLVDSLDAAQLDALLNAIGN